MRYPARRVFILLVICGLLLSSLAMTPSFAQASPLHQGGDSNPPEKVVKLIFIHHSTGETIPRGRTG